MAKGQGLALIFGPPKKGGKEESREETEYNSDISADFRDHCDAAFDAVKDNDRKTFCEELWLAVKAYEETPHEEAEEEEGEPEGMEVEEE